MAWHRSLVVVLIGVGATASAAAELVGVSGSAARYATPIQAQVSDQQVNLVLTGTALRKKLIVNVYTIGSYVQQGVAVRTAEELAAVNCVKRLHLIMERDVAGQDMADAFRTAIRANYASPLFTDEVNAIAAYLQTNETRKGDQVWLTHLPGAGLRVQLVGKADLLIPNPAFSRAVWDIWLGRANLGDGIKASLVARL